MRFILQATWIIGICLLPSVAAAQESRGQISVVGRGEVVVVPDMARITLGVTHRARTAAQALDLMSAGMVAVIGEIRTTGVAETDIQTSQLQLNPLRVYNNDAGTSQVTGYEASSTVTIRVFDLDTLGVILDATVSGRANEMRGLQFDVADSAPYRVAARQAAVVDAMEKAAVFADAAGVELGTMLSLIEKGAVAPPVMMEASLDRRSGVPIAAGDMVISADVAMIYATSK